MLSLTIKNVKIAASYNKETRDVGHPNQHILYLYVVCKEGFNKAKKTFCDFPCVSCAFHPLIQTDDAGLEGLPAVEL